MQDYKPNEDDFDNLETTENSIYTDDYQTEDAFSQIPASNEFVEEETQEISSIESKMPQAEKPAADAFPAIQKLEEFRPKPEKKPKRKLKRFWKKRRVCYSGEIKSKTLRPSLFVSILIPAFKSIAAVVKKSSREVAIVAVGTAVLSGGLLILGFISLHA